MYTLYVNEQSFVVNMQNEIMLVMYGRMFFRCFWIPCFIQYWASASSVSALFSVLFFQLCCILLFVNEISFSSQKKKKNPKKQWEQKALSHSPKKRYYSYSTSLKKERRFRRVNFLEEVKNIWKSVTFTSRINLPILPICLYIN